MERRISPSLWRIDTKIVAGKKFYQVYRLIDEHLTPMEGNRETKGGLYERFIDAEILARRLNAEEAVK